MCTHVKFACLTPGQSSIYKIKNISRRLKLKEEMQYVGQTGRALKKRFDEHYRRMNKPKKLIIFCIGTLNGKVTPLLFGSASGKNYL